VLQIGFFVGALFVLQWDLALVSLIVAPLFFVVARRFSGLIKRASREKRRRSGSLGAVAEETLGNVALVQASGREGAEHERYRREGEGVIAAELSSVRIRGVFSPLVDLIELAGILLVVYFGTRAIAAGGLTLGGMLVFIAYLTRLYGPVRDLSSLSNTVFKALAGAIELDDVWFRYDDELALKGVTLRAAPGAHEFIARLPDGYDTDLAERGRRLSGGQRQRIAIARALLADAPVLILDEPTTGLDAELAASLQDLARDRTTLVISHDRLLTRDADLILVLDDGRVIERGRHDELVAEGGTYARQWRAHEAVPVA
jgi:ABC-type multidrug transport system fused ATPase/permease subunit